MYECFVCIYVHHMCVPAAQSSEEGTGFPGTGMTDSCAMLCGCQECNLAVLQEQVFLIPEPSLWSTSTAPALLKAIEPSWTFLAHSEPQVLGSCRYRDPTGHSTARDTRTFFLKVGMTYLCLITAALCPTSAQEVNISARQNQVMRSFW